MRYPGVFLALPQIVQVAFQYEHPVRAARDVPRHSCRAVRLPGCTATFMSRGTATYILNHGQTPTRRDARPCVSTNKPGPEPQSIGSTMAGFQSAITKRINSAQKFWQRRRGDPPVAPTITGSPPRPADRIRNDIANNPKKFGRGQISFFKTLNTARICTTIISQPAQSDEVPFGGHAEACTTNGVVGCVGKSVRSSTDCFSPRFPGTCSGTRRSSGAWSARSVATSATFLPWRFLSRALFEPGKRRESEEKW